ncbi:hypothetical protein P9112_006505 [Eukaryota sp. TZLM1-RC]
MSEQDLQQRIDQQLSHRKHVEEPCIHYHVEEKEMGKGKEKERIYVEPVMRERIDREPVERVCIITEPVDADEARLQRKVVDGERKELPRGTTKRIMDELRQVRKS